MMLNEHYKSDQNPYTRHLKFSGYKCIYMHAIRYSGNANSRWH